MGSEPAASLTVGMSIEASQTVTEERTARHMGSGSVRVYSTPSMVLFIEETCHKLAAQALPPGNSTVGVSLNIQHLAPTPVGQHVTVRAEVVQVEGKRITFRADVADEVEPVGHAEHVRAIIDLERFQQRVQAKAQGMSGRG
jgi:fluoroacetyl-CoA thioesterase